MKIKHINNPKISALCALVLLMWAFARSVQAQVLTLPPAGQASQFGTGGSTSAASGPDANFRHTEFALPTAPAFSLLNADPSLVTMPGTVRDFKVDWSMRTYKLTPNLSLEVSPIWTFAYDRPSDGYKAYQKAGRFMRRLSSLNLSLGTIQFDTTRQVAFAAKINLFSGKDYYADGELQKLATADIAPMRDTLVAQIARMRATANAASTDAAKVYLDYQIFTQEQQLAGYDQQIRDRANQVRNAYMRRFWNAPSIDLAAGKSYTYFSEKVDSLKLRKQGIGVWLTGGFGVGRHIFLSGIVKYTRISANEYGWQRGGNIRYGGLRYHFFLEGVGQRDVVPVKQEGYVDTQKVVQTINIGYGGAFRIGSSLLLSFGIRTIYDENLKFNSLLPIANLACLMR